MSTAAIESDTSYRQLKEVLFDCFGVILGDHSGQQVSEKLHTVMQLYGVDSLDGLTARLNSSDDELGYAVLRAITEHNVSWFSHREIMSVFRGYILPNLESAHAPYRVWLAGCGKGQTAFSLAIAAARHNERTSDAAAVEIHATDPSQETIEDAAAARFSESFLSGLSMEDRKRYMTQDDGEWVVNDAIRSSVHFSVANLIDIDENPLRGFDMIICPDILVYYTVSTKTQLLERMAEALKPAGVFMVGENEPVLPFCKQFAMVEHDTGVFYRKLA